jgi:hypothetical protein
VLRVLLRWISVHGPNNSAYAESWGWDCFLLSQIKSHKHAWVFLEPVDAEKLQIPDYFQVIKRPMDLGCDICFS